MKQRRVEGPADPPLAGGIPSLPLSFSLRMVDNDDIRRKKTFLHNHTSPLSIPPTTTSPVKYVLVRTPSQRRHGHRDQRAEPPRGGDARPHGGALAVRGDGDAGRDGGGQGAGAGRGRGGDVGAGRGGHVGGPGVAREAAGAHDAVDVWFSSVSLVSPVSFTFLFSSSRVVGGSKCSKGPKRRPCKYRSCGAQLTLGAIPARAVPANSAVPTAAAPDGAVPAPGGAVRLLADAAGAQGGPVGDVEAVVEADALLLEQLLVPAADGRVAAGVARAREVHDGLADGVARPRHVALRELVVGEDEGREGQKEGAESAEDHCCGLLWELWKAKLLKLGEGVSGAGLDLTESTAG